MGKDKSIEVKDGGRQHGESAALEIEKLLKEIGELKRSIRSYKTANTKAKERAEHFRKLDLEHDSLYEKEVQKRYELEESIKTKDGFIEQLQGHVQDLKIKVSKLEGAVQSKEDYIKDCEATIEELHKPWWKKIF